MIRRIINFLIILSLSSVLAFFIQRMIYIQLGGTWIEAGFELEYWFNFSLTLIFGILFIFISQRKPEQLGNAYLASISVKFILFFIIIYPLVTIDGHASRIEFVNFFAPFTVCLLTELLFLIRLLKN